MQNVINNNTESYNLVIKNFEGPLDLLIFLITKNKMNIFDISLSELTDKYVEYLNEMTEQNIEIYCYGVNPFRYKSQEVASRT